MMDRIGSQMLARGTGRCEQAFGPTSLGGLLIAAAAIWLGLAVAQSFGADPLDISEQHRLFATANEHYQNRRFKEALAAYRRLLEADVRDPVLYYNIGNTYVQLGEKGRAAVMYERALRLAPRDGRARKNLAYVRPPGAQAVRPFVLWRPFIYMRDLFALNEWLLIFDGLLALAAAAWSAVLILRDGLLTAVLRRLLIAAVVMAVVAGAFVPWRWYEERGRRVGYIVKNEVVSRHGPSSTLGEHLRLAEGTRVEILGEEGNGWLCIRPLDAPRPARERTYVPADAVEEV